MGKININKRSQTVQFLFTMLLFLILSICAIITITFGTKVYKNIDARMNENFQATTVLSYVSNKVRQADEINTISVIYMDNTNVLRIKEEYNSEKYITLIYYKEGNIKELFYKEGLDLSLSDGINIMESQGISFELMNNNLLSIKTQGVNGDSIHLALRSGVE